MKYSSKRVVEENVKENYCAGFMITAITATEKHTKVVRSVVNITKTCPCNT